MMWKINREVQFCREKVSLFNEKMCTLLVMSFLSAYVCDSSLQKSMFRFIK